VRRVCTEAAHALVGLLQQQEDRTGTTQAKQAEAKQAETKQAGAEQADAKQAYARAMPQCERWMELAPLVTVFRISD
jgi:hypothetical protein